MAKKQVKRSERTGSERLSFEQALGKLEKTVAQLEDGQLGLDESLVQYERGIAYLTQCYRQLERAQRKIELLAGIDENGEVRGEPFAESEMSLEQKQASRSRRRSRSPAADDATDVAGGKADGPGAGRSNKGTDGGLDDSGTLF